MLKATQMSNLTDTYRSKLKINNTTNNNNINNNNSSNNNPKNNSSVEETNNDDHENENEKRSTSPAPPPPAPLKKFNLRGNQLCGSLLIGNHNYLTQLEVSENELEILDLSSLTQLETLKCSRNKLMELLINGGNLTSVFADHNCLHTISVSLTPTKLTHLDISHNDFTKLPPWIGSCSNLQSFHAQHNQLTTMADFLASYKINGLHTLNLSYNSLRVLNRLPDKFATIEKLELHSNELQNLPDNFFAVTHQNLRMLNASCNKLVTMGKWELPPESEQSSPDKCWRLEELLVSSNSLTDDVFPMLKHASRLRVLHAAYNRFSTLPAECVRNWPYLKVLVLSGNMLQQLPDNLATLTQLQVLRVHSNLLLSTPTLSKLHNLKLLDLAHNHLDHVNLLSIVPKSLKYLDLSCNLQLRVDEQQVKACQTQRNWSLVDVSGKNRPGLPTTKGDDLKDSNILQQKLPWRLGFSETPGKCRKLPVSQVRVCSFRTGEGLFGMFESDGLGGAAVAMLTEIVPKLLMKERAVTETAFSGEYMKYTLLAAHQKLVGSGVGLGQHVGAALCHITKNQARPQRTKSYVLRVASVGSVRAYLVRKTSHVCLTNMALQEEQMMSPSSSRQTEKHQSRLQTLPDPEVTELALSNEDEYLVICNSSTWAVMDIDRVSREVRKEENVLLAAKRIQDIAQSFGCEESLSVIVVRFRNIGTDVDHLIKELKQTVRKKPIVATAAAVIPSMCKRACCNRTSAVCTHRPSSNGTFCSPQRHFPVARSDRSSPSGQSDHALSAHNINTHINSTNNNSRIKEGEAEGGEFLLAHAQVLEEEDELEMLEETDSVLSEEQFKCWEYMLEQNTQLLFDKELNTISKSFTKNRNNERKTANLIPKTLDYKTNLIKTSGSGCCGGVGAVPSNAVKFKSNSSPQLMFNDVDNQSLSPLTAAYQQQMSFLSKHFGSSRSFQATAAGTAAAPTEYAPFETQQIRNLQHVGPYSKLGGGPNAAYFGSLQRLMPYNLEYDFAIMQERFLPGEDEEQDDEFHDHDNRIRRYWGVATTEL